jgi:hypothetical protein
VGVEALLARAFHRARAVDANREIAAVRERKAQAGARQALSYEIVIPAEGAAGYLVSEVLPRLVYFLDCRGATLPRATDVFASLFVGEELLFVEVDALLEELAALSGLDFDQMVERWGE